MNFNDNNKKILFMTPELKSFGLDFSNKDNKNYITLNINKEKMRNSVELKYFIILYKFKI